MNLRRVFSMVVIVGAASCVSSLAQETLGDLVASGGYDWILGRWVASTDEGQKVEFAFDWALDKHVVLNSLQFGEFQYQGLIRLSPAYQEAVDEGADSRGGTWKGTWSPEGDGLVRRVEHTSADGETRKGDIVFSPVDGDTITIALYAVESSGARGSEPWNKLTYKRQKDKAAPVRAAAATTSRATDYQKLGDLISEGGYEWLIGKWVGTENGRTYELEYKPILDMHAGSVDLKMGDLRYLGLITYTAGRQEVVEFGADTQGRSWKMVWEQEGSDLVNKTSVTRSDGTTQELRHVYTKIDNDAFNVKLYQVGADGTRTGEPLEQVTFKRQKPAATPTK
jgi:hypothetical protein